MSPTGGPQGAKGAITRHNMEESSKIKAEDIQILVADESHERYVDTILKTIEEAAKVRGTGIAKRTQIGRAHV